MCFQLQARRDRWWSDIALTLCVAIHPSHRRWFSSSSDAIVRYATSTLLIPDITTVSSCLNTMLGLIDFTTKSLEPFSLGGL